MSLVVGKALRAIATPIGMDLTGYIGRTGPSRGVHDPLSIRCVAFANRGVRIVLASCDLLGLSREVVSEIKERARVSVGLDPASVLVACTHTHSGPPSVHLQGCGEMSAAWRADLVESAVQCIREALEDPAPARLRVKRGRCAVAYNRVAGKSSEEDARIDATALALFVTSLGGQQTPTVLLNFACHPVVLTEANLLYSRDYPYFTERELRARLSCDLDLVSLTGCCGDLDPLLRGGFPEAESTGRSLADAVLGGVELELSEEDARDPTLHAETIEVGLPMERAFSHEQLAEMARAGAQDPEGSRSPDVKRRVLAARAAYAAAVLEAEAAGTLASAVLASVHIVRLGPLTLVALPFEAFSEVGQAIKALFGGGRTMVVGYGGGDFGYLPSERLYERSRYEVKEAFLYYGYPGPFRRDASTAVLDALRRYALRSDDGQAFL